MFTGLVEDVGTLTHREPVEEGIALRIETRLAGELAAGESVAVDGVCLSVVEADERTFRVEAVRTTLSRTTLGDVAPGRRVNLERALRVGDRLGGHFVQAHVDAPGEVIEVETAGETVFLRVRLPDEVARITVPRGSLAVDGVSLTVNELSGSVAEVAIVPYTWEHTALDRLEPGSRVNLEGDLLGKYVERLTRARFAGEGEPDGAAGAQG